jgi:hypothetical protein
MAKRGKKQPAKAKSSPVARVRKAVSRIVKKVTSRIRSVRARAGATALTPRKTSNGVKPRAARAPRVSPDIPIEVLNRTYTPKQTSLKSSFRTTGEDRQRDQEFASGYADERWKEEDRLTNKSGDPRIGTHGRRYEPNE